MNRPAVEKLLEHLKEQQKTKAAARFNMKFFGVSADHPSIEDMLETPICNTQCCLAGEAILANGLGDIPPTGGIRLHSRPDRDSYGYDIEDAAKVALGLVWDESERLFYFKDWSDSDYGWPDQFEEAYRVAFTPANRLQVAIDRVQHFLDTDGKE